MKQTLDKFKEDLVFNSQNPIFVPYHDEEMGRRIDGGFVCIRDTKYGLCEEYVFDNGHRYGIFHNTNIIREGDAIPNDYFIHKYIEKCIYDIVVNNSDNTIPDICCTPTEVEASGDSNPIIIFKAIIDRDYKIVYAIEIFAKKKHCGYGKLLLKSIYRYCKDLGYRFLLENTVDSFYQSMVRRGATIIEIGNMVEITDKTNLD